jgi:hypothetical protein
MGFSPPNQQTRLASQLSRPCEAHGVQWTKSHLLEQCYDTSSNVWNEKRLTEAGSNVCCEVCREISAAMMEQ